jgi:hypothetical protein
MSENLAVRPGPFRPVELHHFSSMRFGGRETERGSWHPPTRTATLSGRQRPRRLRGATIALVAVTGLGPRLCLAASIRGERPATFVHLLEAPTGGSASEESRITRPQQLALTSSTFRSGTLATCGGLTLCSDEVGTSNGSANNLTAVVVGQESAPCRSLPAWAGRRPVRQRLGGAEGWDSPCRNHDDAPSRPARWGAVGASERNRWRQDFYCTPMRPAP